MLDLDNLDLGEIAMALDDHSYEHSWYIDRSTGEIHYRSDYYDAEDEVDIEELDVVHISSFGSNEGYRDMEDFIAAVRDQRARDLLERAIIGKGAFRRFKDTLFEFPQLREEWFAFSNKRSERRTVEWLRDNELVEEQQANAYLDRLRADEPVSSPPVDPDDVANDVVEQLRPLYGKRLRQVLLYGSWARGDADSESDIDLLVVLEEPESSFAEIRRMSDVLWDATLRHGIAISAIPVAKEAFESSDSAFLTRVRAEGRLAA